MKIKQTKLTVLVQYCTLLEPKTKELSLNSVTKPDSVDLISLAHSQPFDPDPALNL